ncbi:hypothetical protein GCM10007860_19400 [Chitiniphilus shinanonensis]|uniref:Uncharacterized protein n=1 Tax=Chitiniphilus shinanonensis TaxID=553088 RepID=A0ABQ6BX66_9NEIS|nr:hypothetical protein [Chitiniphilus shinanonensis]GLS04792.1 hypothetical protein GCM10007860_19400 [Chitiniphilus shinanonensis]
MLWTMLKRLGRAPTREQEESPLLAPTQLLPATRERQEAKASHPLNHSLLYRIKRDALAIVADMNRGVAMPDCALLARQLAFVQKELIQAAYHDESLPREQRQTLARYHALNIRQGIGERRDRPLRGVGADS